MGETDMYMDEKWKLSKRSSMRERSSTSGSSSSNKASIAGSGGSGEALLRRSDSVPARSSFSRKCATLVKEQRAKFYIMRRCVTMLMCWKDYRDS